MSSIAPSATSTRRAVHSFATECRVLAKFRAGNFLSRAKSLARRKSPWNASSAVRCRGDRSRCVAIL
eukprot:CAMPEP_0181377718 /NCGR_PEP_ID=MMETSP1106-20121128/18048_1 /TAXON_ID=81844 /ORGANISM="Mantoniella antarctica, Strain SL-175" /LENGTH=66 /DNA_ID=CAMNT_0023496475 /DNA_START=134 /DNA_END=330 /DNA_ORIENTATION=-